MKHYPLIRTIYLYIFALLGLIFLIIGSIRFVDMALKAFVFTQVEEEQRIYYRQPPTPYSLEKIEALEQEGEGEEGLTAEERESIRQWLDDYRSWQEQAEKIDPVTANRQREASNSIAMMAVGLPLYIYHWGVIKKETRNKDE